MGDVRGFDQPLRGVQIAWHAVVLMALWLFVVPLVAWVLLATNVVGAFSAWRYTLPVFLTVVAVTWVLARRMRASKALLATSLATALFLSFWLPAVATPNDERLEAAMREIPSPPGAVLLGYDREGNDLCFQGCPQRVLYYGVPESAAAVSWVNSWAEHEGWVKATLDEGGVGNGWCKGDFSLLASKGLPTDRAQSSTREEPPPGTERLRVRVGANCR